MRTQILSIRRTLVVSLGVLYAAVVVIIFFNFLHFKETWTARELLTPIVQSAMVLPSMVVGWGAGELLLLLTRCLFVSRYLQVLLILAAFLATVAMTGWWLSQWEKPIVYALSGETYVNDRPVSAWVALSQDPRPSVRLEAVEALGAAREPQGRPAVILALTDSDKDVRARALHALRRGGLHSAEAVPALVELLAPNEADEVRNEAIETLGWIGPGASAARPALTPLLSDPRVSAQRVAIALALIGPAEAVAPSIFQAVDRGVIDGADALALLGSPVVPLMIRELRIGSERHRGVAMRVLAGIGLAGRDAVPALRELLKSPDAAERVQAAGTLWAVTGLAAESLPILIEGVRTTGAGASAIRETAVFYLHWIGEPARSAVPTLLDSLSDQEGSLGGRVALALTAIDRDDPAVIEALRRAVTDRNIDTQGGAVGALGEIGSPAQAAVPALVDVLHHPNLLMRLLAAQALLKIAPDRQTEVVAALRELLLDRTFDRQTLALELLGKIGTPEAITVIAASLKDSDGHVRARAAEQLHQLGSSARPALPQLIEALSDSEHTVVEHAAEALADFGPDAQDAVPKLIECSRDDHLDSGKACKSALAAIAPWTARWLRWRPWLIAGGIAMLLAGILEIAARWTCRREARVQRVLPAANPFDSEAGIVAK